MANIICGNLSYTISPDDIDLDYFFRQIHLPKNGLIKPLWTNTGHKQNDYYEFQVITNEEDNDDSEIYYDHNLICESYTCHICNISVPKIYRKEHNLTQKHKVYLEIADKSLERSRKHINEEFDTQKSIVRYDCYFCPDCSAAVATELKGHHEKTPGHLISVKHDDLLKELLKYYLDRDNVKIDFELDKVKVFENLNQIDNTNINDNARKKSKRKKLVDQPSNVVSTSNPTINIEVIDGIVKNGIDAISKPSNSFIAHNESTNSNKEMNKTNTTVKTDLATCEIQPLVTNNTELIGAKINEDVDSKGKQTVTDEVQLLTVKKKKRTKKVKVDIAEVLEGYYKQISLGHKIKLIDHNLLEIEPINGNIVRVAAKNFHSYNEVDGKVRCEICNVFIDDAIESHMFTESHMIYAMAPINDEHCVRKYLYYSHCVLCNEVVKDIGTHILNNKNHIFHMDNALVINKTPSKSDVVTVVYGNVSGKTYCEICEVDVGLNKYESHAKSKKHCENYDRKYPSLATSKTVKIVENKQNGNDLLSITNDTNVVTCKICNLRVNSKKISEHLKENSHVFKYNKILSENELKVCANGFYCEICKDNILADISLDSLMEHVGSQEHISKLINKFISVKFNDYFRPIEHNTSHTRCKICEVNVANELSKIEEHLSGSKHQNNFSELIKINHLTEIDNGYGLTYCCSLCDTSYQEIEMMEHINNNEHREAMKTVRNKISPDNSIEIHPHMQTTANAKELKCKVCLIAVPFLSNSIEEHVIGKNHTKNYNKILDRFVKIDENYFCKICDVLLEDSLLVDHDHCQDNSKVAAITPPPESTEVKMTKGKQIPEGHKTCKICKVSFPNNPNTVEKHNNSECHLDNCTKFMQYNRFADNDDNYFFELSTVSQSMCSNLSPVSIREIKKTKAERSEVIIPEGAQSNLEIYLPETSKVNDTLEPVLHKHMEVSDKPGSVHCKVCKVPVPDNDNCVYLHVNGLKHKTRYNTLMNDNKLDERANCFYCGYCETLLSKNLDIDHVFSDEHKIKMNETANVLKTQKQAGTSTLHFLMGRIENSKYLQCKLCKREIVDEPLCVKYHLESSAHVETYKSFLEENNIVSRDNEYFCKICNELLAPNTEYEHLESKKHLLPNMYVCKVCDVVVPNNIRNIEEHIRGALHKSNASASSNRSD